MKKTLTRLILASAFLLVSGEASNIAKPIDHKVQNIQARHIDYMHIDDTLDTYNAGLKYNEYKYDIEVTDSIALEKAGLKIYGENQQALGTEYTTFYRLVYSNKEDTLNPAGLNTLEKKTPEELKKGLLLKDQLENKYALLLEQYNFNNADKDWGKLINGTESITKGTYVIGNHEAIDIFTEEGNEVLAPFDGLVVASGDSWQGTFGNGKPITWNGKGLSPRSGNAIIIYNPIDKGYMLISHLQEGLQVKTSDIVMKGQVLGYVGHSGSASIKGHGRHIHVAYKLQDKEGYLEGIDFSDKIIKR